MCEIGPLEETKELEPWFTVPKEFPSDIPAVPVQTPEPAESPA